MRAASTAWLSQVAAMRARTGATKSIASLLMTPARNTLAPSRVTWRSSARILDTRPPSTSATWRRIELLPMSMAA